MDASKKILVTGGIKSGKSRYALERAMAVPGKKVFLATAQALDADMQKKIENHKRERDRSFMTVEEPVLISQVLGGLESHPALIVVDCLTLWVSNLIHTFKDPSQIRQHVHLFLEHLRFTDIPTIMVTNEVGLGVVPDNSMSRAYINEIGSLNQEVAKLCDEVVMVVSGLPQIIKGHRTYAQME